MRDRCTAGNRLGDVGWHGRQGSHEHSGGQNRACCEEHPGSAMEGGGCLEKGSHGPCAGPRAQGEHLRHDEGVHQERGARGDLGLGMLGAYGGQQGERGRGGRHQGAGQKGRADGTSEEEKANAGRGGQTNDREDEGQTQTCGCKGRHWQS